MGSGDNAGQQLARGVRRYLRRTMNFQTLEEFVPATGMRVDVMAVGPKGEIWIVECKSSFMDFKSDLKWEGYLDYCDQYFWAVGSAFPYEVLPNETGLIFADQHDAEIIREGELLKLAPARRRKLLLKFARTAAERQFLQQESAERDRILGFRSRHSPSNR